MAAARSESLLQFSGTNGEPCRATQPRSARCLKRIRNGYAHRQGDLVKTKDPRLSNKAHSATVTLHHQPTHRADRPQIRRLTKRRTHVEHTASLFAPDSDRAADISALRRWARF